MEFVEGISPQDACSENFPQELRDRWGVVLCEFLLRGLFEHRFLHADPNLANFSFLEDGRVVVYDFGCVKRIPPEVATGYAELLLASLHGQKEAIPEILLRMGVSKEGGKALSADLTDPYIELFAPILRESPPYTFGGNADLYRELFDLGLSNWSHASGITFPEDVIFVDRALGGHFGNLSKLGATGPWRDLVLEYAGNPHVVA
jgi:predicted unusual protein kinase regulating ubiquinone biosynthesis (AarF/ABC1/UbiB family)